MRVKVELFNAEWRWKFTLIVEISIAKHLLLRVVLEDVQRDGVLKITTNVSHVACLVTVVSLTILENNDVATVVSVELTQDIVHIERPVVSIRGHLDRVFWLLEVLDELLGHDNFSFKSLIFLLKLLLADSFL